MEIQENNIKSNTNTNNSVKIVIIGDQAVGKSSLLMQFVDKKFTLNMMGTAGVDIKKKVIDYKNNKINLHFYDSAGHDRFRHLLKQYLQGCKGIILAYDITDLNSFNNVSSWIDNIKQNADSKVELIIIGNKVDLTDKKVTSEDAIELGKKYNVEVIQASAKTGENVDIAFMKIVNNILEKESNDLLNNGNNLKKIDDENKTNNKEPIKLNNKDNKNTGGCCYMCG